MTRNTRPLPPEAPRRLTPAAVAAAALLAAACATPALAGQVQGTLNVTAHVPIVCSMNVTAVQFGDINVTNGQTAATAQEGDGQISLTCATGVGYTVYLDPGKHSDDGTGNTRNLGGPNATDKIAYYINRPNGGGAGWTDDGLKGGAAGSGGYAGTGTGAAIVLPVQAFIRPNKPVASGGDYSDQVQITVVY